jgi:hypothetical protein
MKQFIAMTLILLGIFHLSGQGACSSSPIPKVSIVSPTEGATTHACPVNFQATLVNVSAEQLIAGDVQVKVDDVAITGNGNVTIGSTAVIISNFNFTNTEVSFTGCGLALSSHTFTVTVDFLEGKAPVIATVTFLAKIQDTSCKTILDRGGSLGDGIYPVVKDPSGTETPTPVYCDMTTASGGWTLIAKVCATDATDRWTYDANIYKDTTLLGDATNLDKKDAKGIAYSQVSGTQLLIRDLTNTKYFVAHQYSDTKTTWQAFLTTNFTQCGLQISATPIAIADDGRDSLIGSKLFWHHYDALVGNCGSQERAMLSEYKSNAGWTEVGIGLTEGNASYRDAQSAPSGASQGGANVTENHEDYAFFVR